MEIWKNIEGYENYQVSNLGRVKSLNYNKTGREEILKCNKSKNGYLRLSLHQGKDKKTLLVHRLVAQAFIPNPDNKPEVNHKNTIKDDNRLENLEWCTKIENQRNPLTRIHYSEAQLGTKNHMYGKFSKQHHRSRSILQFTKDGILVKKWDCTSDVERELNISQGNISKHLKGKFKTIGGYVWKYYDIDTYCLGKLRNKLMEIKKAV